MSAYWLSILLTLGALAVGYLLGMRHPINRYDDIRSEVGWLREQAGMPQRYSFVESARDRLGRLFGRPQGSSVRTVSRGIWQHPVVASTHSVANLNEEAA